MKVDDSGRSLLARPVLAVPLLTLALGFTVFASWLILGGAAYQGGHLRVLRESWPLIYGAVASLGAGVLYLAVQSSTGRIGLAPVAFVVAAAWLGELAFMTVGGGLLANELNPTNGWFFWLIGTGGPVQPVAALIGGWLVLQRGRGPRDADRRA